jgi:hypothetical protein
MAGKETKVPNFLELSFLWRDGQLPNKYMIRLCNVMLHNMKTKMLLNIMIREVPSDLVALET